MNFIRKLVDKFTLGALLDQRPAAERNEELLRRLAQVDENNHCLFAVRELLSRHLVVNIATAGSIDYDDRTKLRACERMEFARMFLTELETERANAAVWLQEQQANQTKP